MAAAAAGARPAAGAQHRRQYRAVVLLGAFCCLRIGELAALRRAQLDLEAPTVTVLASAGPSVDAALRYQHATRTQDVAIAAALSELVMRARPA